MAEQDRRWLQLTGELARERHRHHRRHATSLPHERSWLGPALPRADLAGGDAHRHRPGASLSLHPQPRLHHLPRAEAPEGRRHDERAAADPAAARPLRAPARARGPDGRALHLAREHAEPVHPAAVPGLRGAGAGRVPPHPRQRHRDRGRGRRPGAAVRERAEAPPPRRGDPHGDRCRRRPPSLRDFIAEELDVHRDVIVECAGLVGYSDTTPADPRRAARPQVQALQRALPRAHPRPRRRLLRRDPPEGHRRPPPLRELRRGGAVPAPGGGRSGRRGDQADALPHLARIAHRRGAGQGGGGRQVGDGAGRAQGALRRGGQHPVGARPRARRRAGGLRLHRAQDPRQGVDGGAPRGRRHAHLCAFRHRQLSPDHRQDLYRPLVLHLRSGAGARRRAAVQLHHRLCPAGGPREDRAVARST